MIEVFRFDWYCGHDHHPWIKTNDGEMMYDDVEFDYYHSRYDMTLHNFPN